MAAESPTKNRSSAESEKSVTMNQDGDADSKSGNEKTNDKSFIDNPASDFRNLRRIIAEDQEWSLATVPTLDYSCITHIVDNFEANSAILNSLSSDHQAKVLEKLPMTLPLKVTALLIKDEGYWKRCCENRWKVCNVKSYGSSWKRMYFERNLEHIIEEFVPEKTDPIELNETLELSSDFVIKLDVRQFLPPVNDKDKNIDFLENSSDTGSEVERECDHFNMAPVLEKLRHLRELHLTYSVQDCGMNFEWNMFYFTKKDCQRLCEAVKACHTLNVLHLHRSKLSDENVRLIVNCLMEHPNIEELDFSHNLIGDRGSKAICKLITTHDKIKILNLCNNMLRIVGGQALAHALVKTNVLKSLNLRLNRIGDEGGLNICKALTKNTSLKELNMAANDVGALTADALAQVFLINKTLTTIDLSCNNIGMDGGKQLLDGMAENNVITELDLRLTECGQEVEFGINQILDQNKECQRDENFNVANKDQESVKCESQQL